MKRLTRPLSAAIALISASLATQARAQVRGDLGAFAGVSQRVLVSPSGGQGTPGPLVGVEGHVALMPLLRLGGYVTGEIAPTSDVVPAKDMLAFGVRAKIVPPWPRGDWHIWGALGFGFVTAYSPSYSQKLLLPPSGGGAPVPTQANVDGAGGGFFEVPLSFGASYRVRKPLVVFAELTTRFGFGFFGTLYGGGNGRSVVTADLTPAAISSSGTDVFAAQLAVGAGFDL